MQHIPGLPLKLIKVDAKFSWWACANMVLKVIKGYPKFIFLAGGHFGVITQDDNLVLSLSLIRHDVEVFSIFIPF
jgi:hypothetical protein